MNVYKQWNKHLRNKQTFLLLYVWTKINFLKAPSVNQSYRLLFDWSNRKKRIGVGYISGRISILEKMSFIKHQWKTLSISLRDTILTISMNRPKVNAMSPELLNELIQAFNQASNDQQVRGVHLRSDLK